MMCNLIKKQQDGIRMLWNNDSRNAAASGPSTFGVDLHHITSLSEDAFLDLYKSLSQIHTKLTEEIRLHLD